MMVTKSKLFAELLSRESDSSKFYTERLKELAEVSTNILSEVRRVFKNYTKHDINHSYNILEIMADLCQNLEDLTELELCLLISSAITHDLGMFVSEPEIESIREDQLVLGGRMYSKVLAHVGDRQIALEECVRPLHATRSRQNIIDHILNDHPKIFRVFKSEHDYFEDLCLINSGHNESLDWIRNNLQDLKVVGTDSYNAQYIAIILRLSDLLDVDDRRTPLVLREHLKLPVDSKSEWDQHMVISNHNKIRLNDLSNTKIVFFDGETSDPKVYRKLLDYFQYVQGQLSSSIKFCQKYFRGMKYQLNFEHIISNNIVTKGFKVADFKLDLNYNAVTELLMGESIYGSKDYGIRELIQNALDACELLATNSKYNFIDHGHPSLRISWSEEENTLTIRDFGIGMTEEVLRKYFLNVGVSYYKSNDFRYLGSSANPIGNYGIGFLACFMLSPTVRIETRNYFSSDRIEVSLERSSEYIGFNRQTDTVTHGTKIVLDLCQVKKVFKDVFNLKDFIEANFLKSSFEINLDYYENTELQRIELQLFDINTIKTDYNWVDLSKYFDKIDVHIKLKERKLETKQKIVEHDKDCFVLDTSVSESPIIRRAENSDLIKDFIVGDTLSYIEIPLITGFDMYEAMQYADDFDSALNTVEHEMIIIFFNSSSYDSSVLASNVDDYVFYSTNNTNPPVTLFQVYESFGKSYNYDTDIPMTTHEINYICSNSKYLEIQKNKGIFYPKSNYRLSSNLKSNTSFYVKGVLIKNFEVEILPFIAGIEIENAIINSYNSEIIPVLSRNSLKSTDISQLRIGIGYAMTNHFKNKYKSDDIYSCLELFSQIYYPKKSELNT